MFTLLDKMKTAVNLMKEAHEEVIAVTTLNFKTLVVAPNDNEWFFVQDAAFAKNKNLALTERRPCGQKRERLIRKRKPSHASCWSQNVKDGVSREFDGVDRVLADTRTQRLNIVESTS